MLPLDNPRWAELSHAYGKADDVPELLRRLETLPTSEGRNEPWFSIWSALAHQGDVYSASFAAVPHIVHYLATDPNNADFSYFGFPGWVEVCRVKRSVQIPPDLEEDYFAALNRFPSIIASASERQWDEVTLRGALSAIAAAKGQTALAEVICELSPEILKEFFDWFENR